MRQFYDRGDLPVSVNRPSSHPSGGSVVWEVEPQLLDYDTYLPMFFGGLVELEEPYALFARRGVADMLEHGEDNYVATIVPRLVSQIRSGLSEESHQICTAVILSLHQLIKVGKLTRKALLPFLKNLLPCMRRLLSRQNWSGYEDGCLDADNRAAPNMACLVEDTLQILHKFGGNEAYKLIKAMCPTYSGVV